MKQNSGDNNTRRYDIDHLRVLAFGLLIFYHTAMLYVEGWGFHIKSGYQSDMLANIMLLVNPWRMPLIWMISGIASYFLLKKLSFSHFLTSRTIRLLLPLFFGILFIVPFQLYFEMKSNGDMELTLWQFWQVFFDLDNPVFEKYQSGILPHIDVNHLWYLRALWPFSLALLVLSPLLNKAPVTKAVTAIGHVVGRFSLLLIPILLLVLLDLSIFSQAEGDRERQAVGFTFFIFGYLIANQTSLWHLMKQLRRPALVLSITTYAVVIYLYQTVYLDDSFVKTDSLNLLFSFIYQANLWLWLVCIFGYAFTYLNKKSQWVSYLNPAVYPFYILHQSVIIGIGYPLIQLQLGGALEASLILIATLLICTISYEFIRRTHFLKPFFGLTISQSDLPNNMPSNLQSVSRLLFKPAVYQSIGVLLVLPIALPIFMWVSGLYLLL